MCEPGYGLYQQNALVSDTADKTDYGCTKLSIANSKGGYFRFTGTTKTKTEFTEACDYGYKPSGDSKKCDYTQGTSNNVPIKDCAGYNSGGCVECKDNLFLYKGVNDAVTGYDLNTLRKCIKLKANAVGIQSTTTPWKMRVKDSWTYSNCRYEKNYTVSAIKPNGFSPDDKFWANSLGNGVSSHSTTASNYFSWSQSSGQPVKCKNSKYGSVGYSKALTGLVSIIMVVTLKFF
jgi:hypothetical protein